MRLFLNIFFGLFFLVTFGQVNVSSGKVERVENFPSKLITPRNVDIWLPEGYNNDDKYAVLYMHDGQMLFDSTTTWNKQEWGIDEHVSKLMNNSLIKPTIVVGIWNAGNERHSDYFPQYPFEKLETSYQDSLYQIKRDENNLLFAKKVNSDNYLKFIVNELKPYIDSHYNTFPEQENTTIMGSSMGGLISLYAICEFPQTFGKAACISTHWPGALNPKDTRIPNSFLKYIENYLPCQMNHSIYFDFGTETIDAWYESYQNQVDELMLNAGYNEKSWVTKKYDGADHSEKSWNNRLEIPLQFLLK